MLSILKNLIKEKMQDSYWCRVEVEFGLGVTASDKEERQMKRIRRRLVPN